METTALTIARHVMHWSEQALCHNSVDPEAYFDVYEENKDIRKAVDSGCMRCPVQRMCFSYGVSTKQWGVWGGVYLADGEIDTEFGYNSHKTGEDWADLWEALTIDVLHT